VSQDCKEVRGPKDSNVKSCSFGAVRQFPAPQRFLADSYRHACKIVLWLSLCPGFEARVSGHPLVQTIIVHGTERPLQLETKAGEPLEIRRVSRDVKRLWATGWFDDIRVETESVPAGVVVQFKLAERERYLLRRVRFKPRHFELPSPVPPGTQIDRAVLERLAKTLEERLKDSGYRDAIVRFELIPTDIRQADVLVRVNQGRRYVIDTLEVSGISSEDSRQVAKTLQDVRPRRLLPGIPHVWEGWKLRHPLNQGALNLALQRLRSNYISRGYLDATAVVEAIGFEQDLASVSVRIQLGAAYHVESLRVSEGFAPAQQDISLNQFPLKDLCDCLMEKRAEAERDGVSDFGVELLVRPTYLTGAPRIQQSVSLTARIHGGPPYRVRTIEFRGNHNLSDITLRRMLLLSEGDWFDRGLLRRSLTRLNLTGIIHPVGEFDVEVQSNPAQNVVDLVIPVRERDRGRWSLGAPVWGGFSSSAWFSIGSRLPNWGPSYLELPTYFVAFNITSPFPALGLSVFNQPRLSISLARPYLPGHGWWSGFQVSPQTRWDRMLLASGLHQLKPRLAERLQPMPSLPVPLRWNTASPDQPPILTSGALICEPPRKPMGRLLSYFQVGTEWLLPTGF
jgi:outer membrane protein assembly factor BamA